MTDNYSVNELQRDKTDVESLPLLPRFPWNSQLTYLKVLLQTKQALDKTINTKK